MKVLTKSSKEALKTAAANTANVVEAAPRPWWASSSLLPSELKNRNKYLEIKGLYEGSEKSSESRLWAFFKDTVRRQFWQPPIARKDPIRQQYVRVREELSMVLFPQAPTGPKEYTLKAIEHGCDRFSSDCCLCDFNLYLKLLVQILEPSQDQLEKINQGYKGDIAEDGFGFANRRWRDSAHIGKQQLAKELWIVSQVVPHFQARWNSSMNSFERCLEVLLFGSSIPDEILELST